MRDQNPFDSEHLLREWRGGDGFLLRLYETGRTDRMGKTLLGYELRHHGKVIFTGRDFGLGMGMSSDGDEAVEGILGFLSLRPGDTDPEYFEKYTPAQLAWARRYGEELSLEANEIQERLQARRSGNPVGLPGFPTGGYGPMKTLVARWESRGKKHWVELYRENGDPVVGSNATYTYRSSNGGGNMGYLPFHQAMEQAKHQADLLGVQITRVFPQPGQRPPWRDQNPRGEVPIHTYPPDEDQPTTCPKCGSRTDTTETLPDGSTKEKCINDACQYTFLYERDDTKYRNPTPFSLEDDIEALAAEFSRVLARQVGRSKMERIVALNRRERDPSICHSHDFVDANMTMEEAFRRALGRKPVMATEGDEAPALRRQYEEDSNLMEAAWDLAKAAEFRPLSIGRGRGRNPGVGAAAWDRVQRMGRAAAIRYLGGSDA